MSLRSIAAADIRTNLNADGDPVTLTDPDGTEYEFTGWIKRTDVTIDPDTGEKINDPRTVVTVATADLPGDSLTEEWTVLTTDGAGNTVSGQVMAPKFDRTGRWVIFDIVPYDEA